MDWRLVAGAGLISALSLVSNIILVIENRRLSRENQRLRREIRQLQQLVDAANAPAGPG